MPTKKLLRLQQCGSFLRFFSSTLIIPSSYITRSAYIKVMLFIVHVSYQINIYLSGYMYIFISISICRFCTRFLFLSSLIMSAHTKLLLTKLWTIWSKIIFCAWNHKNKILRLQSVFKIIEIKCMNDWLFQQGRFINGSFCNVIVVIIIISTIKIIII